MSVIYAGKPSMFLTCTLLIAAQEAAQSRATSRAASNPRRKSHLSKPVAANAAGKTQ
jgi:hypothetical protein